MEVVGVGVDRMTSEDEAALISHTPLPTTACSPTPPQTAQLRGLEGELRPVRQPHATQPHGPAVLHSSLAGPGHPPSLTDLEASEPSSGLGAAVSDLLAIQNTGIPLPTPTPPAPEPFHPSPMETDLIFRPCASDADVGAPLLPASPHPSPSPAPPITTSDSSEGTATADPTDTVTSPDEVLRVRGGYLDILCAILARVSQDPEAPGPGTDAPTGSGDTARVFKHGRHCSAHHPFWTSLLAVYQLWLRGYCAPAARSLLASSTLVALAKPNLDVRPIAIGEVLIRILSRAVCLQLRDQMARVFLASQHFGVGVTCGTEVVVRGIRRSLDDHPEWVVLQLDVANAFNSFHRDAMFQALYTSAEFRCLIPFIRLFYGTPSDLLYRANGGVTTIHSERGTRQGDPLNPFLYALTQRVALQPVLAEGDVQLWSYADDTYVLGPPSTVLHHFAEIVRHLRELGLVVQPHKCLVYGRDFVTSREVEAFTSLGIEVARRGLTVTGVPVGSDAFVERSLPERLERMGRVLPWLPRLRQPQTAALCGASFRQSFASDDVDQIDRSLRTALEGLPRDILSLFPPWHSCVSAAPDSLFTGVSHVLEARALESFRARHTNPLHLARLTSLQGEGAGAWLTAVPYADSLRIPEAQWQMASAFCLGLPIPQLALAGRCSCGQAIYDMTVPHHVVRCSRFGIATVIHDTVKCMLRDFASEAGFAMKVEDTTLILHLEEARARLQGLSGTGDGVPGQSGAPWGQ
ncbi:unnamed protein product [Closterium sp. NIES-65]|nr:unnamed protein product [Closterium sp. NIES-65]